MTCFANFIHKYLFGSEDYFLNVNSGFFYFRPCTNKKFVLKIKKGMYSDWEKRILNEQWKFASSHFLIFNGSFYCFLVFLMINN